jgi:hypothetical protein
MPMKPYRSVLLALLVCAVAAPALAGVKPVTHLNYQGVLRDEFDRPLTGNYDMVFRFFSASVGGDEILIDTLPSVPVSGGMFSVQVGRVGTGTVSDGSGPGYFNYLPTVFGRYNHVYLELSVDGEQLLPRMEISSVPTAMNARYVNGLEIASRGDTVRYVDAVTGSDDYNGIFPTTPKRTISSMLAEIPAVIDGDVTINIAPGTYNESLTVHEHVRVGSGGVIHLIGNPADPASVIIDGSGLGSGADIEIRDSDTQLNGLTIQNFEDEAVEVATGGGWTEINNCRILNNTIGVVSALGSDVQISNTIISGHSESGVQAVGGGVVEIDQGTEISNNSGDGLLAWMGGIVIVVDPPCTFTNNDLVASEHSTIQGYGVCTLNSSSCVPADPSGHCVP